jgi:hypothetical protein
MKRIAAAGTFALLAGGATLLLLASIFYSCHMGGHPHDMGNEHESSGSSHSSANLSSPQVVTVTDHAPAHRLNKVPSSAAPL